MSDHLRNWNGTASCGFTVRAYCKRLWLHLSTNRPATQFQNFITEALFLGKRNKETTLGILNKRINFRKWLNICCRCAEGEVEVLEEARKKGAISKDKTLRLSLSWNPSQHLLLALLEKLSQVVHGPTDGWSKGAVLTRIGTRKKMVLWSRLQS